MAAPTYRARAQGRKATGSDHFERLASAGHAARGVVYAVVGLLAIQLALGTGGKTTDQQGALRTIAEQSFGKVLLALVALGLFGYALWRLTRAALGHGKEVSDDAKERIEGLVSGLAYGALGVAAVKLLLGGSGGGGGGADKATGGALTWPGGPWLVGIAGAVVIGAGLYEGYRGVARKFCDDVRTGEMSRHTRRVYELVGLFGHLARMVVFALIGAFLIKAAIDYKPKEAVSLDGALAKVADAPAGPLLLGAVAIGLLGYAAYCFMDAKYARA